MSGTSIEKDVSTVPLLQAVFCVDCETVSDSAQHTCTVCGSSSVISLFRLLGGSLRGQKVPSSSDQGKKYELELMVKVRGVPAGELNDIIQFVTRLAELGGEVGCLHINLESGFQAECLPQAA